MVSYGLFEMINEEYVRVDRSEYEDYSIIEREMVSEGTWDVTFEKDNETISKTIVKLPETVSYDKLVVPMFKEMQNMREELDLVKSESCNVKQFSWC